MFFRILKKDLKRKKTMNIILLLFVILCSMFAAASVNNIIAVTGGIDKYFDKAGMTDVEVSIIGENKFEEEVKKLSSVTEIKEENYFTIMDSKSFVHNGVKLTNFINPAYLFSDSGMALNYFDKDNNLIKSVKKGTFYATTPFTADTDIEEGDDVTIKVDDMELTLKYMGYFKGATFPTVSAAGPYLILNSKDFDTLESSQSQKIRYLTKTLYINTNDLKEIEKLASECDVTVYTKEEQKGIYLYDMLTAYIMMAISIVLMITAFVVLRFTIGFTLAEEFREIGVMKAVGINNISIRGMYITKYLAISVIGALIGFFGSIPLQDLMLKTVSKNIVLESENGIIMGLISCVAVVLIILLFCYMCTRRVNKLSPIDAVRSGQTGERFKKKSVLKLGKSKLPSTFFMAVNDVFSAPKRFCLITLILALCMLIISILSNFVLTLKSDKILWTFSVPQSEAHIGEMSMFEDILAGDVDAYKDVISDIKDTLEKENMPAEVTLSMGNRFKTYYKDKDEYVMYWVTKGETDYEPKIDEGSAPKKTDEIAMTGYAMKSLGVDIGDRIKADFDGTMREFIITGRFSTFEGAGYTALLYKDAELPSVISTAGIQIHFDGNPDNETIEKNIKRLRTVYDTGKIYNTSDFINTMTGISGTLDAIKKMMMILTAIVTVMIIVLMERSFISKEKSEIALQKAVGISNGSIIAQHTLRFVLVSFFACVVAFAALMPVSNVVMNYVCSMIGDIKGVKCAVNPIEIFVICPILLILVATIGAFLTALYTKTIKSSDTASIE